MSWIRENAPKITRENQKFKKSGFVNFKNT